ncbi:hypothetical protein BHE97_09270 [Aeromicrobium sp. PE09-221]|nr:hypothetical protein BHE97_09270 [Aeromicrobium sp. PE09-221]
MARATESVPDPAWIGAAVAVLAVLVPPAWRLTRHAVTLVHEAGHAAVALATGRRVRAIRLHRDTSGITESIGRPHGPGMIVTAFAGYTAPPLLGVSMMLLVLAEREVWAWWAVLGVVAAMVLVIRNWFGLLVLLVCGGGVWLLQTRVDDPEWARLTGYAVAWFLVLGGLRATIELAVTRRRRRDLSSDAAVLARLTVLPAVVWNTLFITVAVLCGYVCWLGAIGGVGRPW